MHQDDSSLGVGDDVLAVEELGSQLIGRLEVAGLLVDLVDSGCRCSRLGTGAGVGQGRSCHGYAGHRHGAGNRQCAEFAWE